MVHHADAVGEDVDDGEVVADEQTRELQLLLQFLQEIEEAGLDRHVQRGRRLVGDEKLRRERERAGDADALALASGELMREAVAVGGGELHLAEELLDATIEILPLRDPREEDRLADGLADRHPGIEGGRRVLEHDAGPTADREQILLRGIRDVGAHRRETPLRDRDQTDGRASDGGLAGAGLADEPHDLTGVDLQIDVLRSAEGRDAAPLRVLDRDVLERQDGCAGLDGPTRVARPFADRGDGRHSGRVGDDLLRRVGVDGLEDAEAEVRDRREELLGVGVLRRVEDLLHTAGLHHDAVLHHHDAVGEVGHDTHVVRDQDDRRIQPLVQVPQQIEDLGLHRDVERRGRFVGDEQKRIARDRLGDHRTLPLPARELMGVLVERLLRVRHLHETQQLDRALAGRRRSERAVVRAQRLGDLESDRVDRVQRRHRLLEDHRDVTAAERADRRGIRTAQLAVEELHRTGDARVLGQQAEQGHRARALARAGLADDREDLAAANGVVHVDGGGVELTLDPEVDVQTLDLEDRLGEGLVRRAAAGGGIRGVSHACASDLESWRSCRSKRSTIVRPSAVSSPS